MSFIDAFADALEDRYQERRVRPRRHRSRGERSRRRHGLGWSINGPNINFAEMLKAHLGRTIPAGDNTIISIPHVLSWTPDIAIERVRLEFHAPIAITVEGWLDWHLEWLLFEDWSDQFVLGIKPKFGIVDRIVLKKDWSSP